MTKYGYRGTAQWGAKVRVYRSPVERYTRNSDPIGYVWRTYAGTDPSDPRVRRPVTDWIATLDAHPGISGTRKTRDAAVDDAFRSAGVAV